MTEVQIWTIAVGALVAGIVIAAIVLRRRQRRAHPHGHIVVDMTVPRTSSVASDQNSDGVTHDRPPSGRDTKEV